MCFSHVFCLSHVLHVTAKLFVAFSAEDFCEVVFRFVAGLRSEACNLRWFSLGCCRQFESALGVSMGLMEIVDGIV